MRKNLFISNFKRAFSLFLVIVILLGISEFTVRHYHSYIISKSDYILMYKRDHMLKKNKVYSNGILLGDSRAMGVDARMISDEISAEIGSPFRLYNYSFPGFGVRGYYLLLKKYLHHNQNPQVIFFVTSPLLYTGIVNIEEKAKHTHYHRFSLFFDVSDYKNILSLKTTLKIALLKLKQSSFLFTYRREIRNFLVRVFSETEIFPGTQISMIESMNGGSLLGRENPPTLEKIQSSYVWKETFQKDKKSLYWFKKFFNLAQKEKIKVVILNMPLIKSIFLKREQEGFNQRYKEVIKEIANDYKNITIISPLTESHPPQNFLDADHLNETANHEFSKILSERIIQNVFSR